MQKYVLSLAHLQLHIQHDGINEPSHNWVSEFTIVMADFRMIE